MDEEKDIIIEHKRPRLFTPEEVDRLIAEKINIEKPRKNWFVLPAFLTQKHERPISKDEIFSYLITPSYVEIRPDYARINETYHRVIQAVGYPRKVEDGWLGAFLNKNENYDISIHLYPSVINDTLTFLQNQIMKQTADLISSTAKGTPNPSLEIKLADTKKLYDALYKGEEKLFRISLYIDNKEATLENLNLLTEKCKSNLNGLLIIPKTTNYRMYEGLRSCLPLSIDELSVQQEFPTYPLAATFPFLSSSDSDKKGILFAHEEETLNPIFIDFGTMSNKHFFILGISGSGKSYTAKYLMLQILFAEATKIFILDPNAEYKEICKKFGGENIELSRVSKSMINVFDLAGQDLGSKLLTLVSIFDIIVGGLSESQKGVLNRVLPRVYEQKGIFRNDPETWKREPPTFSEMYGVLGSQLKDLEKADKKQLSSDTRSVQVLINRIGMYCRNGFFGFMDRQTDIDLRNKFLNFDLSELPHAVKPLMMFLVLDFIKREIEKDKNAKVLLIDEGWALLRSKEAEEYLLNLIKTSRKFNASIGFITQEIEDLLGREGGKSILNQTSVKILMKQSTSNIDLISGVLKLNRNEKDYLIKCTKGHGLIITEHGRQKFFAKPSPKIHDMITTDPEEVRKMKTPKDEQKEQKEGVKIFDIYQGFYLKKDLTEDQCRMLENEEYTEIEINPFGKGRGQRYYVTPRPNEGPVHFFFCKIIEAEAKKYTDHVVLYATHNPDVVVMTNNKRKICFEVETGVMEEKHPEETKQKYEKIAQEYDDCYILVTHRDWKKDFEKYGKVILRTEIEDKVKQVLGQ
ncbi:ATP-binding protein [Candidatus Micrarchaeota archaeon]|nr:ATP-binding protein [Candidatus Micrarchaeota archaeon]